MKRRHKPAKPFVKPTVIAAGMAMFATSTMALTPIEEIDVSADLTHIENYDAAIAWRTLPEDLERRLYARLDDALVKGGGRIEVEIDTLSLASNFEQAANLEEALLTAEVTLYGVGGYFDERYEMTVSAEEALRYIPEENRVVAPEIGSFAVYAAMLDAFADSVVARAQS